MIGVEGEVLAFHHVFEVADAFECGQEFAVIGRPSCLIGLKFGAVESKRLPTALFKGAAECAF